MRGDELLMSSFSCTNKQISRLVLTCVAVVSGVTRLAGAGVGQRALHVPPTLISAHSCNKTSNLLVNNTNSRLKDSFQGLEK